MASKPKKHVFKVGDLVMAKVKGFSPWPSKVIEVVKPGKYKVLFFGTHETSSGKVELTPYDVTFEIDPKCRRSDLKAAFKECREIYEQTMGSSSSREGQNESPGHLEIDNGQQATIVKCEQPELPQQVLETREPSSVSPVQDEKFDVDYSESSTLVIDEKEQSLPVTKRRRRMKDSVVSADEIQKKDKKGQAKKIKERTDRTTHIEPTNQVGSQFPGTNGVTGGIDDEQSLEQEEITAVDCSLNDLTSEQANAERGIRKPFPTDAAQETNKVKTIEKLKKKLQKKLDEKEDKKKNRIEKKMFEKASTILPKFNTIFQSLTQAGERFVINSDDTRNAIQLKMSMKNCEKSLDLLSKCVTVLSSEYGRAQNVTRDFHTLLSEMVTCLRDVKMKNVKPTSKDAKHFLNELKYRPPIKAFINKFNGTSIETKEELTVERKENARKRARLSR